MADSLPNAITAREVIDWMEVQLPETDPHLALVVPAVTAYVDALPNIARKPDDAWADTTRLGAVMLAARLYQRKNSQAGVVGIGDVSTYIPRYDNDIARLLNLESFRLPVIG